VPTLSIYDASFHLLGSVSASSPLDGNLNLTINNIRSNATYYFEVNHSTSDPFSVGTYQIDVTYQNLGSCLTGVFPSPIYNTLTKTARKTASVLRPDQPNQTDQRFDYTHQASINILGPQHYYQIQAPSLPAGGTFAMHALAWGTDANALQPVIHVFDGQNNPIAIQVLANGGGLYSLQLANAVPGATYKIEVAALHPNASNHYGHLLPRLQFDSPPPLPL